MLTTKNNQILVRSIFWVDANEKIFIADGCEVVAVRPNIKFLLKDRMNGFDPFNDFQHVLDSEDNFPAKAKYQKACLNAYFKGKMGCVS